MKRTLLYIQCILAWEHFRLCPVLLKRFIYLDRSPLWKSCCLKLKFQCFAHFKENCVYLFRKLLRIGVKINIRRVLLQILTDSMQRWILSIWRLLPILHSLPGIYPSRVIYSRGSRIMPPANREKYFLDNKRIGKKNMKGNNGKLLHVPSKRSQLESFE